MFNECLDIAWKTAHFCILNFSFKNDFVWEEISNIQHSVSSPDETLRLMFDIFNPGQNILGHVIKLGVRTNFAKLAHIVPLIMLVILVIQI